MSEFEHDESDEQRAARECYEDAINEGKAIGAEEAAAELATLRAELAALRAELAIAEDAWQMANGTADLAMKHRDMAEAELAALRAEQTDAARDVMAERRRQIEAEGWTPEHDDEHDNGEMAEAAACYAACAETHSLKGHPPLSWPWSPEWWKPSPDPRRNLVMAAALLLAEIERLDRARAALGERCPTC